MGGNSTEPERSPRSTEVLTLVNEWCQRRYGKAVRWAGKAQYEYASLLIKTHGLKRCLEIMPHAVRLTAAGWPEGKTICAVDRYWDEAVAITEQEERKAKQRRDAEQQARLRAEHEARQKAGEADKEAEVEKLWAELSPDVQKEIEEVVRLRCYMFKPTSPVFRSQCHIELMRRSGRS